LHQGILPNLGFSLANSQQDDSTQSIPEVSVVLPNFNHGEFIRNSILSILNQSVQPLEIIVIDDASTDRSVPIIEKLIEEIPTVRLIRNKENKGVIYGMNLGTMEAEGEIVLYRAADDHLLPDSISHAQEAFAQTPSANIAFGETIFFQGDPSKGTKETLALSEKTKFFPKDELLQQWIPDFNLPSSACFVRKSAVLSFGGFKEKAKWHSDWLCFTSIALRDGLCFIPSPITGFRLNSKSYGNSSLMKQKEQRSVLRFMVNEVMKYENSLKQSFIRSGAFTIFGNSMESLLEEETETLPEGSGDLLKRSWVEQFCGERIHRHGFSGVISQRIEEIREELSFLQQTESLRVFIYGAGLQTSILLKIWEQSSLPEILGIIITEKNDKTDFNGYPMIPLDTLTQSDVDFILLSSKSFESEMASNLDAKLPTVKRLSFWIKELTRL
jgi:glycosyltransferase involved in cell wall biosynthesis